MRRLTQDAPRLTLRVREADTEEALDRLLRDETDVVVGLDGEVRVDDARFSRTPMLVDPLDIVLPAGHPRADTDDLCLADLPDQEWIVPQPVSRPGLRPGTTPPLSPLPVLPEHHRAG